MHDEMDNEIDQRYGALGRGEESECAKIAVDRLGLWPKLRPFRAPSPFFKITTISQESNS